VYVSKRDHLPDLQLLELQAGFKPSPRMKTFALVLQTTVVFLSLQCTARSQQANCRSAVTKLQWHLAERQCESCLLSVWRPTRTSTLHVLYIFLKTISLTRVFPSLILNVQWIHGPPGHSVHCSVLHKQENSSCAPFVVDGVMWYINIARNSFQVVNQSACNAKECNERMEERARGGKAI